MTETIQLGFEVGTGTPVEIPIRHMVVAGQTQEAGKTTTMEALISRGRLPAIAFVTKRGEQSFSKSRKVDPYFRERADWQFVASVLEATMRERFKFERSWIISASKGAKTLADVQKNVRTLMKISSGLSESVYLTLDAYLDIVVPKLAKVEFAKRLDITRGINTLDLSHRDNFPPELQSLVMRSCLEWVYERCEGTIAIIPEAWEFIPQSRGSPVKLAAVELIRKGAGLRNYVWLDSQDIGGIDKEVLRQCAVWLLGVQRETNEIKRTLSNIPAGIARPSPADIAHLDKGQFFACWGKHVIKTYVWPEWMDRDEARDVAIGKRVLKPRPRTTVKPKPSNLVKAKTEKDGIKADRFFHSQAQRVQGMRPFGRNGFSDKRVFRISGGGEHEKEHRPGMNIPSESCWDHIRRQATPDKVGFIIMLAPRRIGGLSFLAFLEHRHFTPVPLPRDEFELWQVVWQEMVFAVCLIPGDKRPEAEIIARELGLRFADAVPHLLTGTAQFHFPIDLPNVFTLENVPGHFAYRNNPAEQKTAWDYEREAIDRVVADSMEKLKMWQKEKEISSTENNQQQKDK